MLNLDRYQFKTYPAFFDYAFQSVGPKGIINKVARFTLIEGKIYNYGFGDLNEGTGGISYTIVSNNKDGDKILATVAYIIYYFTRIYQDASILIQGSNDIRNRWYQMGMVKYWDHIQPLFEIIGYQERNWEHFRIGVNYEAFIVFRKPLF